MPRKRPPQGQEKLFHMPIPALEEARATLRVNSVRNLFSPVTQEHFDTLRTALATQDNYYAESALGALDRFEALAHATRQEGFDLPTLTDDQLGTLERHKIVAEVLVSNTQKAGVFMDDPAVAEATTAITRTTYQASEVVKQAVRKELAAREAARSEGQSLS